MESEEEENPTKNTTNEMSGGDAPIKTNEQSQVNETVIEIEDESNDKEETTDDNFEDAPTYAI